MDEIKYLQAGLNALSRAHELNYFDDGHRGGAIISGVYLCRENKAEAGLPGIIAGIFERLWTNTELCTSFPEEPAQPALLQKILDCMQTSSSRLREAGHNIILPTLALKAFQENPEAITPSRVAGICKLIESFKVTDVPVGDSVNLPDIEDQAAFANFVHREFVQCTQTFSGRGQGWSGHLLTYSRALQDLVYLGYNETAQQALAGYRLYLQRIRSGPQETDKPRLEHSPTELTPLQEAYWAQRDGDLYLGHMIKYPYGFYGLLQQTDDEIACAESLAAAYRIF